MTSSFSAYTDSFSAPQASTPSQMAALLSARNAPRAAQQGAAGVDALGYCKKNRANNSTDGAIYPSLYEDDFGRARQCDVRQLQKILVDANGGWQRLFTFVSSSAAPKNWMIFDKKNFVSVDGAGIYKRVPALRTVAEHMHSRLDVLIGHAWDSRPQRVEAAYSALRNIINYAPNWGETAPDGSLSLSYIQFACGLSHMAISDTSMTRPILGRLTSALARCAALEVLKEYLLKKISSYEVWLQTALADGVPPGERLPVESKAQSATAAAMLIDRALDAVRMRIHVFKGMELAQSLANLKQSILARITSGNVPPPMQAYALQSVQMIDAIIAQAADAFVPCSLNCTTTIVHERAGHLEEIAFGSDALRCRLAEDAMAYGYEALAMQLDAKRYCPSTQHVPLTPQELPANLPTNMMTLN